MPDLSKTTPLVFPTSGTTDSYALVDYEQAKFSVNSGSVSVNVTSLGNTTSYLGTVTVATGKSAGTLNSPISGLIRSITQQTPDLTGTGTATTVLVDSLGGTIIGLAAQNESVITTYGTTQPISTAMKFITSTNGTGQASSMGIVLNVHYER